MSVFISRLVITFITHSHTHTSLLPSLLFPFPAAIAIAISSQCLYKVESEALVQWLMVSHFPVAHLHNGTVPTTSGSRELLVRDWSSAVCFDNLLLMIMMMMINCYDADIDINCD